MKVVITALLSFFLLIQSALAADVELNTLRIFDKSGQANTYLEVHKIDNILHFDLCDLSTHDCDALTALDEYYMKHMRTQKLTSDAVTIIFGTLAAFGLGAAVYTGNYDGEALGWMSGIAVGACMFFAAGRQYRNGYDYRRIDRAANDCNENEKNGTIEVKNYDYLVKQLSNHLVGY